jgi:hypothetical protein
MKHSETATGSMRRITNRVARYLVCVYFALQFAPTFCNCLVFDSGEQDAAPLLPYYLQVGAAFSSVFELDE